MMLWSFGTPGEEEEEGHGDLGFIQLWGGFQGYGGSAKKAGQVG